MTPYALRPRHPGCQGLFRGDWLRAALLIPPTCRCKKPASPTCRSQGRMCVVWVRLNGFWNSRWGSLRQGQTRPGSSQILNSLDSVSWDLRSPLGRRFDDSATSTLRARSRSSMRKKPASKQPPDREWGSRPNCSGPGGTRDQAWKPQKAQTKLKCLVSMQSP